MLADVTGDNARVSIIAAAGGLTDDETDGFVLVEVLGENRLVVCHQQNKPDSDAEEYAESMIHSVFPPIKSKWSTSSLFSCPILFILRFSRQRSKAGRWAAVIRECSYTEAISNRRVSDNLLSFQLQHEVRAARVFGRVIVIRGETR